MTQYPHIIHKYLAKGFLLVLVGILYSCASTGQLGGGPEDKTPPKLVIEKSATNLTTNYEGRVFTFEFDEFIEVKNPTQNIIITPPLTYVPEVKLKGKKLTITLNDKEVLRENITYQIDFGEAIQDFRAANKLKNFRHVFSTGDQIDSLSMSGKITTAATGDAVKDALVLLYEEDNDSCVIHGKPYYMARTDNKGIYQISYIKQGTYRVYACSDENKSLFYNQGSESIGFLEENIIIDTALVEVNIKLSKPLPPLKFLKAIHDKAGLVKLAFNQEDGVSKVEVNLVNMEVYPKVIKDTIHVYFKPNEQDTIVVQIPGYDTLFLKQSTKLDSALVKMVNPSNANQFLLSDTLVFTTQTPIELVDKDSLIVDTSGTNLIHEAFLIDAFSWGMVIQGMDSVRFTGFVDSMKVVDIYGMSHKRSSLNLISSDTSEFVNLTVVVTDLDSTKNYEASITQFGNALWADNINGVDTLAINLGYLMTEEVTVTIYEDRNNNGKPDPAIIWGRQPPEPILIHKINALKAGWAQEEVIEVTKLLED